MKRQILISLLVLFSASGFAGADNLPLFGSSDSLPNGAEVYKQNELIVRFADPDAETRTATGPWSTRTIRSMISSSIVDGAEVEKVYDDVTPGLAVVKLPAGTSVMDALAQFNGSAKVVYAEPNYKYKLFLVPNDPNYPEQWALDNTGQSGGTPDADIDANDAWDINTGDPDIIIAITDTGIDYQHPDLADNMWVNEAELNGSPDVDDDGNGYVDDIYGYDFAGASSSQLGDGDSDPIDNWFHGTHVAGVAGAVGDNGEGIAGICWNVKLMALKIFADDFVVEPEVFASDAIEAIEYAVDNGAKIINASWGGSFYSQALYDAIKKAGNAGLLFVAAAGNDWGNDNDANPVYPASYDLDSIISVTSTNHNDELATFANTGVTSVDLAEPGEDILSTAPTEESFPMLVFGVSTNYATLSGTSLSAPYAAGSCALIWAEYPTLPGSLVKGILLKTVDPIVNGQGTCLTDGRINMYKALTLIPKGRAGKVLNSKDDPTDPNNLYDTIQDAIDDANDGDELIAEAGTLFIESVDFKGKAVTVRSGSITMPDLPVMMPESTLLLGLLSPGSVVTFANGEGPDSVIKGMTISWGSADYGAGIACYGSSPTIEDCIISDNFANFYGAGIDCYDASPTIRNCTIKNNRTLGMSGIGGGINCEQSSPAISNCLISNNFANNVGGAISCYESEPNIFNCVIANNSAVYGGGGIDLDNSSPVIANCTIIVDDPSAPKDGGISAIHESFPTITNCILWGNGDDLYNASATYSCIEDNDGGEGNIHVEPTFTTGPFGDYYLSQIAAGQTVDSTCVDLGNAAANPELQIETFTTRTDGEPDRGALDIGAHYPALPALPVELNVTVMDANAPVDPNLANGHVDPNEGTFRQYEIVQLTARPKDGYRVKAWTGTDDDSSTANTNTVTMLGDAEVTVEFEEVPMRLLRTEVIGGRGTVSPHHRRGEYYPDGAVVTVIAIADRTYIVDRWSGTDDDQSWASTNTVTMDSDKDVTVIFRQPKSLLVPGQYPDIFMAIDAAHGHGDKVVVSAGTYYGGIDFMGKAVTVASEHPDDPCSVAATIIETFPGWPAFIFQTGEGNESVVDGFTIVGSGDFGWMLTMDGIGTPGNPAFGGAISCLNGSSPTLAHLVIRDVVARGGDGENNAEIPPAQDPPPDPLDPLDPNDPLPAPDPPDPNDPNQWAPADPNRPDPPDPNDPNATADGYDGLPGADGLPGDPGMDGLDGMPGMPGGDGGGAYGGAMYFDADSSPVILNCTFINCMAIGGDGGYGGLGQDGGDGQQGQQGQDGQEGQPGGEGLDGGEEGAGGAGGNGGDGGVGGNGGRGGDGGKGGDGGEAIGGAMYFGPNCTPTIRFCQILNCATRQGLGNYGGAGGNGGNGGEGAEPGEAADGGDGNPAGAAGGADGAESAGGNGGDGGIGGDMGVNGTRSWAGAIFFGENCQVTMSDTIISDNAATTIVPFYEYSGGNGGNGGDGGDGEGAAAGGTGGIGGDGGAGGPPRDPLADPNDPNFGGPGYGGIGGAGGAGGEAGADGFDGFLMTSYTPSLGGANYYESGCQAELTNCTISFNASRQLDESGEDGGGEYYEDECTSLLDHCEIIGNLAGSAGSGGGQYFSAFCSLTANDSNYVDNSSGDDGGGLFFPSDCVVDINNSSFVGNSSVRSFGSASAGGGIYGGGVWDWTNGKWFNGNIITVNNSYFGTNKASFGGGLYWHGEGTDVSISNSVFGGNIAEHGGGMYWSGGAPVIAGCSFTGNSARTGWFLPDDPVLRQFWDFFTFEKPFGGGGGIFCWSSDAIIENCFITGNSSAGSGGGVYFGGDSGKPKLKNCLVRENSAVLDGGGIVSYWHIVATISNCTILDNRAHNPDNAEQGRGGGLACSYESQTTLVNSILWGNTATNGNQILIGSDDEPIFLDRPASLAVSHSNIQGGRSRNAIYVEPGRILSWLNGNINADPLFVGSYYLSQIEAGEAVNSPAVDAGSDSAANLGLDQATTRSDGVGDAGVVDMGLHYPTGAGQSRLTVRVIGGEHGTVEPLAGSFDRFTVVKLIATVDAGYRIRWIGTDDDSSEALINTVTMDSDKTVSVEFAEVVGRTVTVPGDFLTLQNAVHHAQDGDTIVLDAGTYFGGYSGVAVIVDKAVTIQSRNPEDPNVVSATIIDGYIGTNQWTHIGIIFAPNTDSRTVLNGVTIQNCGGEIVDGDDGDRNGGHPDGFDGGSMEGAGIRIEKGAGPIIKNCIIRDCWMEAGDGGDGENATNNPVLNAGRGGWGGWIHGCGIYCGVDSSPQFINCIIENNEARGGNGGNGGNDASPGGEANYGGNWSRAQALFYDPFSAAIVFVPGDLWDYWTWDWALNYGPIYDVIMTGFFGDYRWYSGYGGGAYCDIRSNVSFINCEIRGNRTVGGISGVGGQIGGGSGRLLEPVLAYEIPTYGAGVYCAADSTVTFTDCTFEDNVASGVEPGVDPNHRLDPYIGYGGGVCAENSAAIVFVDCNFVDNEADSGGGIHLDSTEATIIDCNVLSNTALRGGGLTGIDTAIDLINTEIVNNTATVDVNDPNDPSDPNAITAGDILASGAGIYCWLGGLNVRDCNVSGNLADYSGGGAYLRDVGRASFVNNLIVNNAASRDGGGISLNWFTEAVVSNCTFASNASPGTLGETDKTGYGGGLSLTNDSECLVTNSIFWDNYGLKGTAMAVGAGYQSGEIPSTLTISHSDVKNARSSAWVERGSTLNWDESNIQDDPLFVAGPEHPFYLSQVEAGQSRNSPCLDTGSDYASHLGLIGYVTRTDQIRDEGIVDMGYHQPKVQPCRLCDLAMDGIVDFGDFARLAESWLDQSCSESNAWCQGSDITADSAVDFRDVIFLADCWLATDTLAPSPNPSQWETEPNLVSGGTITMTAEIALDAWGWDVEYYFECVEDTGCHDSGWQTSPIYTDGGLTAGVEYGYRVRVRDGVGNTTEWSVVRYAGLDSTPPAPAPYIDTIVSNTPTSITMTATPVYDDSDVEYYFENTTIEGHDSGWQADPNFVDVNLAPDTEYSYRVIARDLSGRLNQTPWSDEVTIRTQIAPDLIPPTPDPMEWDPTVDPNGFDGTPHEIEIDDGTSFDYWAEMTAVIAVDAGGGPVEYFFECTTQSGFNSGWQASEYYLVLLGRSGQNHVFRVRARDQFLNETDWSVPDVAD